MRKYLIWNSFVKIKYVRTLSEFLTNFIDYLNLKRGWRFKKKPKKLDRIFLKTTIKCPMGLSLVNLGMNRSSKHSSTPTRLDCYWTIIYENRNIEARISIFANDNKHTIFDPYNVTYLHNTSYNPDGKGTQMERRPSWKFVLSLLPTLTKNVISDRLSLSSK